MSSSKLLPGSNFPAFEINIVGGGKSNLAASNGKPKLIVVYRGAFCPFCQMTLKHINEKLGELEAEGVEVIAISADTLEVATAMKADMGLNFTIGYGLDEVQIRSLGLYVSDPTHYIPQTHRFAEPGYFFLLPDNRVQYITISNHPMGGRVNVDSLLMGYKWSQEKAKETPAFATYLWGTVV